MATVHGLRGTRVQAGQADGRVGRRVSWWPKSSQNRTNEFQTLGAENRKAWDPDVKLWREVWKLMRTGWAQRPRKFIMLQDVIKVWWATNVQSF